MRLRKQIKQFLIFLSSVLISLFFVFLIIIIVRSASKEDVFSAGLLRNDRAKLNRLPDVIQTSMIPKVNARQDTSTVGNPEPKNPDSSHLYYYIIIGSFTDLAQARQKADKLQNDLQTKIIVLPPSDEGYIRISEGKYSTFEEALSASKDIRKNVNPDAWILSMKD
jgi:hypothetical protein